MLATDGSIFMRQPRAVVYPKDTRDVLAAINFARKNQLTIHPRGAGSGLCGSSLGDGIVIDFTRHMHRLIRLDVENRTFECQPGYRLGELNTVLADKGLFFPPDPSSGEYATFGGMFGTNASGAHSVKYGNVSDYIADARVVMANGDVIQFSDIENRPQETLPAALAQLYRLYTQNDKRIESAYPAVKYNVTGYNLRGLVRKERLRLGKLFAGAEGTLGVATRLKFKLLEKPYHESLVVCFSDRIEDSARAVQKILPMGPSGIEIMDSSLLQLARETDPRLREKIPADVDNVLLIEFDAMDKADCVHQAAAVKKLLAENARTARSYMAISRDEKQRFWAVRTAAVPILYKLKGTRKILALTEDAAVPVASLVDYFQGIQNLFQKHAVRYVTYGHIAKGLMHTRPLLDLKDRKDVELLKVLADDMFQLVHGLGGVVSGEHGDGRLRSAYIRQQYPDIYDLFIQVKNLFDPRGMFNPEIKTSDDPAQMTHNLRFGEKYTRRGRVRSQLLWEQGFADEVEKCHGCSKCTTVTTATRMCPVYKFNRCEAAAPKAKANILRALISGAVANAVLFENAFQAVIKLCANCGSCRHECPSGVNIPKLAIEARAAYQRKFGPGLSDRLLTGVESAARLFGGLSGPLKPVGSLKPLRRGLEKLTGIAADLEVVHFAPRPLPRRAGPVAGHGPAVLYFAGCYATYIRPEIGTAALAVMREMGLRVYLPEQHCCGLPMLSKGMIQASRKKIQLNLRRWRDRVDRVDHIVTTCSSCSLALTREWRYLDDSAIIRKVAGKTILLSSLVNGDTGKLNLAALKKTVAYHSPCHLRGQSDPGASLKLLGRIPGLKTIALKSHCCGIAGTWGMTVDNFDTSKKLGCHLIKLLDRSGAVCGVTDCPTCRIQMEQFGSLPILHPIEIAASSAGGRR
ncbi:MAG: FAD-binding protein [Desulfobacterales bacterium]|nr:FAD-binding protein [Desulfobacterales bacterium]